MWATSEKFRDTLGSSHFVVQKLEVLEDDDVLIDLSDPGVVFEGSVDVSRSEIQRTVSSMSIVDRDGTLTPDTVDDLFMPSGRQLRLWRGVSYPDSTPQNVEDGTDRELVPLGTFRYTQVRTEYPKVIFENAYDRAWIVQGAGFAKTYVIPANTEVSDAINAILWQAYPNVPTNLPDTGEQTPRMVFEQGTDPWQVCRDLAANVGMRIFFDPMGVCVMQDEPDVGDDPIVWEFDDSDEQNFALGGLATTWNGEAYNAVVVIAENAKLAAPITAIAYDSDPDSPTKFGGIYGRRYMPLIRDEKLFSLGQAERRAKRELLAQLGLFQKAEIPTLVIPQMEVGDVVLAFDSKRHKIRAKYIVDGFTVPLRGRESMNLQTRARQVTSIEYAVGALASPTIDGSSPPVAIQTSSTTTTVVSSSFTPPADSLILVCWVGNETSGNSTDPAITDSSSGGPLAWTRQRYFGYGTPSGNDPGQIGFWTAPAGSAPTAMTVTVTNNAPSGFRQAAMKIYVLTGMDLVTPWGVSDFDLQDSADSFSETWTATRTNSWVFIIFNDFNDNKVGASPVAGSGVSIDATGVVSSGILRYLFGRRTLPDGVGGSFQSASITNLTPGATNYGWAYIEMLPAVA